MHSQYFESGNHCSCLQASKGSDLDVCLLFDSEPRLERADDRLPADMEKDWVKGEGLLYTVSIRVW